jgi:hypothetical protein
MELRWKKVGNPHIPGAVCVANSDFEGEMVVLQYRETEIYFYETIIDENGIKTLNPIVADWQDVEISDD